MHHKAIENGAHGFRYDGGWMGFEKRGKAGW
jgi:hypothetical protein